MVRRLRLGAVLDDEASTNGVLDTLSNESVVPLRIRMLVSVQIKERHMRKFFWHDLAIAHLD